MTYSLDKMCAMSHYQLYVMLQATILGTQELSVLTALQHQYLFEGIHIIPVHNMSECVESMLNIAKVR